MALRYRGATNTIDKEKEIISQGEKNNLESNNQSNLSNIPIEAHPSNSENPSVSKEANNEKATVVLKVDDLASIIKAKEVAAVAKSKSKRTIKKEALEEPKRKHQYLVKDSVNDKIKIQAIKEKKELHEKLEEYIIKGLKSDGVEF